MDAAVVQRKSSDVDLISLPEVIKGKSDWRDYRPFKLPNGVTCLLVHDKESKTTAASVCVNVGASADPRELSGLAHFTEHMCFLGSEKYPGENEYKRYLSCHGGRSNASTSMQFTTYKFDVLAEHAEKAMDIFSNFFVSPLFTQSGTSREVNAVDSENSKNLTTDGRRRLQILKALSDQNHHYSKFSTGNADTLPAATGVNESTSEESKDSLDSSEEASESAKMVRDALLAFHKRHYRPDNMTVVIVGPQSLDELQEWIVPRFAPIADRWGEKSGGCSGKVENLINEAANDAPENSHDKPAPPFNPAFRPDLQGGVWPVLLTTLPLRAMRKLVLNFPLPSVRRVPDQSPVHMISHLLGHEGPGSSFAVLQDAGLLSSLSTGSRISAPDQCLLQIDVALTEEGEERWKEVVRTLFEHCRLVHRTAVAAKEGSESLENVALHDLRRIWGEVATLNSMHFHQSSPGQAYDFAPNLAQSIIMYGSQTCLSAGSLLGEGAQTLPLDELIDFSSRLNPSNCIVERCSKSAWEEEECIWNKKEEGVSGSHFGPKNEKWYGIDYYLSEIDPADKVLWEQDKDKAATSLVRNGNTCVGPLHLPRPNRYIPRSLDLCSELPHEATLGPRIDKEIDPPKLVVDDKRIGRLWHRLDDRYALPKSSLTVLLRNFSVENTYCKEDDSWLFNVDTSIRSHILIGIFSEAMAQETYDADLAGLYWSLSKSSSGITLTCGGYSDRLPDLATRLLREFLLLGTKPSSDEDFPASFLQESFFVSTKDRLVRGFKSYFESRRADSHAMYYRDLLMSSKSEGLEKSLAAAESATFESVIEQHKNILQSQDMSVECLFTGNVSEAEAKDFFAVASDMLQEGCSAVMSANNPGRIKSCIPGPLERRLVSGEDIELHFSSKNPEEENGAVLMTFQSPVPGFKGSNLSLPVSLKHTAAIRLLCHMLKEPLFDELRTKQQLGYVVSSYYDVSFAYQQQNSPATTPIDSIVVNVLSRKASPPEVALRIDEFLASFRCSLVDMPLSEINDHSDALSKKLLKPIQKLGSEAGVHFGKIRRYGPEVLSSGGIDQDLPWNSVKQLANAIELLERADLLEVWDGVVAKKSRARIVSCVYGKTFPLSSGATNDKGIVPRLSVATPATIKTLDSLLSKRKGLRPYDGSVEKLERGLVSDLLRKLGKKRVASIAAVALIGAGFVGLSAMRSRKKEKM